MTLIIHNGLKKAQVGSSVKRSGDLIKRKISILTEDKTSEK